MNGAAGLVLTEVSAGYGETVVLEGISLAVLPGQTLAVLGRNGVGKTTLLATIMGHTRLHGGGIRFAGGEIATLPPYRRARLGIGFVPQEREIFPSLTVEENLTVAERPGPWTLTRVYDFFPSLAERRRNHGNQLSGGEQQMLAIGRALMGNPTLLLMDELALLLVEQHAQLALELAQIAVVLDRGAIVFSGASRELLDAPDRLNDLMGVGGRQAPISR